MFREYQVVLEFGGDDPQTFERVLTLQARLEGALVCGEIDGNDAGRGVVNLFVVTQEPERCFAEIMRRIADFPVAPQAAGYRDFDEENYVRLWPEGDTTCFELR